MTSDNQFTALGPATVGFQTHGTHVDRGAEIAGREFGVFGAGTVGLIGEGEEDGVRGHGGSGRGGRFASGELHAQLRLDPQPMAGDGASRPAEPSELVEPALPWTGERGDLWMTELPDGDRTPVALWLCVRDGHTDSEPARWCQVLLGRSIAGTAASV
jgi:hypothetical protein